MSKPLFIGLELPGSVQETLAQLDPEIPGVEWLPASQMHLTMSSLGRVGFHDEGTLREALAKVHVPPFFLPVQGVGVFGGEHPSVVWAGVGRGHPHLFALHKHVQDALLQAGLKADLRSFHPHVTMARVEGVEKKALSRFLRQHEDEEFALIKVTSFALFASVPAIGGSEHVVEMRRDL